MDLWLNLEFSLIIGGIGAIIFLLVNVLNNQAEIEKKQTHKEDEHE